MLIRNKEQSNFWDHNNRVIEKNQHREKVEQGLTQSLRSQAELWEKFRAEFNLIQFITGPELIYSHSYKHLEHQYQP